MLSKAVTTDQHSFVVCLPVTDCSRKEPETLPVLMHYKSGVAMPAPCRTVVLQPE